MGEIIQLENLGFCLFGEGGIISERSETRIGGRREYLTTTGALPVDG